jgi:ABC-type Fe3+ transport system substrate-binding protein
LNDFDPRFRLGSRKDGWAAIVFELFASTITWRTDRVKKEDAPKTLYELADAKWKGRVGTTTHLENLMNGLILVLGEEKGMDLIRKLAALNNRLYRSHGAFAQGLAAGEFDIAWDFLANRALDLKRKGAPVDFVFQDPLLGIGATVSVAKGARNPYAAALFMEHMTTSSFLEVFDRAEPGRMFGHMKGKFTTSLSEYPNLSRYGSISPERFKELNRIADQLFIR